MVEVRTRASEAKGPFPGGKRVGSRGKKKKVKKARDPPIAVGGLEGIGKRVGSRGKKKRRKKRRNGWNNSKRKESWELGEKE